MSQRSHRARYRTKIRTAKAIMDNPHLEHETKLVGLALLRFADDDGVIRNWEINEYISAALNDTGGGPRE